MKRAQTGLLMGSLVSVACACASVPPPSPSEPVSPAPVTSAPQPEAAPEAAPEPAPPPTASNDASPPLLASAPLEQQPATTDVPERGNLARSPVDVLTNADTAFVIDYVGSAPIETARQTCAEKSDGDPAAQAKCLSEARDAFKADVIRFRKDGAHWSWTVYKRAGNRLDEVTSGRVTLTEASPSSVSIKFVTGRGSRPLLKNKREAVLTVPNDYSFEIDDPEWGKLEYEAKVGLVAN